MAFKYSIEKFPVAAPSKLLATNGGKHIYNVELDANGWNGMLLKKGKWQGYEYYAEDTATEFEGIIVDTCANGNFLVEVVDAHDVLFVYNPPVVEAEYNADFSAESSFYIAAGEIGRAHELAKGDIFELSANGFSGTAVKGATVNGVSGKKPVVSAAASV